MRNTLFLFLALAIAINTSSCKDKKEDTTVLTKEITFKKDGTISVYKKETDSLISTFNIETAEGEYETQTGLMYRKGMPKDAGMLFMFENTQPRSFYMKNTEFALDIIYINENKIIEKIYTMAKPMDPTSLPSHTPIKYVLELNGAVSSSLGVTEGDRVAWVIEQ